MTDTHTIAKVTNGNAGGKKVRVIDVTISSYNTGGTLLTPTELGFRRIDDVVVIGNSLNTVGKWVSASNKLYIFQQAAGAGAFAEFTSNGDAGVVRIKVTGK